MYEKTHAPEKIPRANPRAKFDATRRGGLRPRADADKGAKVANVTRKQKQMVTKSSGHEIKCAPSFGLVQIGTGPP